MPTVKRQATITAMGELYVYSLCYDDFQERDLKKISSTFFNKIYPQFQQIAESYPREQARLLEVAKQRLGDKYDELAKDLPKPEEAPTLTLADSEMDFAPVHPVDPYANAGQLHMVERRSYSAGIMNSQEHQRRKQSIMKKMPSNMSLFSVRAQQAPIMPIVRESDDESDESEEDNFGW